MTALPPARTAKQYDPSGGHRMLMEHSQFDLRLLHASTEPDAIFELHCELVRAALRIYDIGKISRIARSVMLPKWNVRRCLDYLRTRGETPTGLRAIRRRATAERERGRESI